MTKIKMQVVRNSSKKAQARLLAMTKAVKNPTPAHKEISSWLLRWVNDNFKTEGGKVSKSGWKKLKAGGRWRRAGGGWLIWDPTAKILQDTGILRASFAKGRFYSRTEAGVGSQVPYSVYHETGDALRGLPQRRMLPDKGDKEVNEMLIKIYDTHIMKAQR